MAARFSLFLLENMICIKPYKKNKKPPASFLMSATTRQRTFLLYESAGLSPLQHPLDLFDSFPDVRLYSFRRICEFKTLSEIASLRSSDSSEAVAYFHCLVLLRTSDSMRTRHQPTSDKTMPPIHEYPPDSARQNNRDDHA